MCDEGVIGVWGIGINCVELVELLFGFDELCPSGFLLVGCYTLFDHECVLQWLLLLVVVQGVGMVVGALYSFGVLVGGIYFEYVLVLFGVLDCVWWIWVVVDCYGVMLKVVGL